MLGENVRRMRSYSNITKTRLALMVSIGRPLLNRIEDGTADVRLSVVTKLADSLATTPSFLLAKHSDEDIRHEIAHRKASSPVAAVRYARFYSKRAPLFRSTAYAIPEPSALPAVSTIQSTGSHMRSGTNS